MYALDFEEFLWGMGVSNELTENMRSFLNSKTVIPQAVNSQMMNYYVLNELSVYNMFTVK